MYLDQEHYWARSATLSLLVKQQDQEILKLQFMILAVQNEKPDKLYLLVWERKRKLGQELALRLAVCSCVPPPSYLWETELEVLAHNQWGRKQDRALCRQKWWVEKQLIRIFSTVPCLIQLQDSGKQLLTENITFGRTPEDCGNCSMVLDNFYHHNHPHRHRNWSL